MSDKQETVRVKIPVAVDTRGHWHASKDEETAVECLEIEHAPDTICVHYVEANVPIPTKPEPQTIEGEVADAV